MISSTPVCTETRFKPAGEVLSAKLISRPPPFIFEHAKQHRSAAQAKGIRYEVRAHHHFSELHGVFYLPSQWYEFNTRDGPRWCQTDGLIFEPHLGLIVVLEMKYNHSSLSWWQLFELYLPVVRRAFSKNWTLAGCEIVKWFDPAVKGPAPTRLCRDPLTARSNQWNVHICPLK